MILSESLNVIENDITEEYYVVKIPKSKLKLNGYKGEGSFKMEINCSKCNGYGIRFFRKCKNCSGKGKILKTINFDINLRRKGGR